ncbi:uncharacterized protein LOC5512865 isoform X1 [Nematostella vectensis]|uniref:uncharacterized protein LOC5512865 isoform X1 n=2 Tax=Nematostella vectensis TaxID=45351 RepID=UPI0020779207|nr:uncharacterized protein LOC5512865 isoform X1 [Nematostella vectensis]
MEDILKIEREFLDQTFKDIKVDGNYFYGVYDETDKPFESVLRDFFSLSSCRFVKVHHHAKAKGHKRFSDSASPMFQQTRGHVPIEFFGHPFQLESTETRHCLHGSIKDSKGGRCSNSHPGEHDYAEVYRYTPKRTRKVDCPAVIQIRCIRVFKGYAVNMASYSTPYSLKIAKTAVIDRLKKDLHGLPPPPSILRYFVKLPLSTEHTGHLLGEAAVIEREMKKRMKRKTRPKEKQPKKRKQQKKHRQPNQQIQPNHGLLSVVPHSMMGQNLCSLQTVDSAQIFDFPDSFNFPEAFESSDSPNSPPTLETPQSVDTILETERQFVHQLFTEVRSEGNYIYGVYDQADKTLDSILKDYFHLSSSVFVKVHHHSKEKGHKRFSDSASPMFQQTRGNVPIEFFGHPFQLESTETRHCLHGSIKDSKGGKIGENRYTPKRTRKVDCPAVIQIRCIRVFKGYTFDPASYSTPYSLKMAKAAVIGRLKTDLQGLSPPPSILRYFVKLPLSTEHTGHLLGPGASHKLVDKTPSKRSSRKRRHVN